MMIMRGNGLEKDIVLDSRMNYELVFLIFAAYMENTNEILASIAAV